MRTSIAPPPTLGLRAVWFVTCMYTHTRAHTHADGRGVGVSGRRVQCISILHASLCIAYNMGAQAIGDNAHTLLLLMLPVQQHSVVTHKHTPPHTLDTCHETSPRARVCVCASIHAPYGVANTSARSASALRWRIIPHSRQCVSLSLSGTPCTANGPVAAPGSNPMQPLSCTCVCFCFCVCVFVSTPNIQLHASTHVVWSLYVVGCWAARRPCSSGRSERCR